MAKPCLNRHEQKAPRLAPCAGPFDSAHIRSGSLLGNVSMPSNWCSYPAIIPQKNDDSFSCWAFNEKAKTISAVSNEIFSIKSGEVLKLRG